MRDRRDAVSDLLDGLVFNAFSASWAALRAAFSASWAAMRAALSASPAVEQPLGVDRMPLDVDGVPLGVVAARGVITVAAVLVPVVGVAVAVVRTQRVRDDVDGVDAVSVVASVVVSVVPSMRRAVRETVAVTVRVTVGLPAARVRVSRCGDGQAGGSDKRRHAQPRAAARENRQSSLHLDTTLL